MTKSNRRALIGSFIGYGCQALTNNFPPLLFVLFQECFHLQTGEIGLLIVMNFSVQLAADVFCARFIERIGYRRGFVAANLLCAGGIASLVVLPLVFSKPLIGILLSILLYASGGGTIEVLVTPIVEAIPYPNKERMLSFAHSSYCFGYVLVVLGSTLFFSIVGLTRWRMLALLWSLAPLINGILFLRAEVPLLPSAPTEVSAGDNASAWKTTGVLMLLMLCAGASETSMAEWSSYYAEAGLHVSKTVGDILGPCLFAFLMGTARILFGLSKRNIPVLITVGVSAALCACAYIGASMATQKLLALLCCGATGFFVGVLWPGILRFAGTRRQGVSTRLYAWMAMFGDMGCGIGPAFVGMLAQTHPDGLSAGLGFAALFPLLLAGLSLLMAWRACSGRTH